MIMKKYYKSPVCEMLQIKTEGQLLKMSVKTGNYDGSNDRPIPTGESTKNPDTGGDNEEATAKRWHGSFTDWDSW